jgi:hypothetical protein
MHSARLLRRLTVSIVGAIAALAVASVASAVGTWSVLAPVPAPTEGMQVGDVGNQIIAAYGFTGGDTNLTRIYDIDSDSWSFGTPGPLPVRAEGAAASHGGNLYAVGGRSGVVLADLDRYTPATDTWVSLAGMPTARAGLAVAVVGNAIFAIGGRTGSGGPCSGGPLATVERYDIDTDTWSTAASLPSARSDLAAYTQGGKIYVFGGCTAFGFTNAVDVYDPVTDSWSTVPADMPTARAAMYAAGGKGNRIYVIGGWNGGGPLPTNEFYTVAADAWSTDTPMATPRAEMGLASHGGRIYTVGGALPAFGASSNANEVFKP